MIVINNPARVLLWIQLIVLTIVGVIIIATTPLPSAEGQFQSTPNQPATTYTQTDMQQMQANGTYNIWTTTVLSGSMLPSYEIGATITVDTNVPFETIKEGDVIVFEVKEEYKHLTTMSETCDMIMHRVVDVDDAGDLEDMTLTTKGDAAAETIEKVEDNITKDMYVGKVVEPEARVSIAV